MNNFKANRLLSTIGCTARVLAFTATAGLVFACSGVSTTATDTSDAAQPANADDASTTTATATRLVAQDLTLLYPYPTSTSDFSSLLTASSAGAGGDLVPQDVFAMLPTIGNHPVERANNRAETYLVAVRANCSYDTSLKDRACRGQLQLVFQTTGAGAVAGGSSFMDASVHAVYPLEDARFKELLKDLLALHNTHGGFDDTTLSVHPIMAKQGLSGQFAKDLNGLVAKYAGPSTLHKVTFITIEKPNGDSRGGEVWKFGAVEEKSGKFEKLEIPGYVATTEQTVTSVGELAKLAESDFQMVSTPAKFPTTTDLSGLFGTGSIPDSSKASVEAAYDTALALENPKLRSAADSDCITCHITHARRRGELLLGLSPEGRSNYFSDGASLKGATVRSEAAVRALGWSAFAPRPSDATPSEGAARSVSQRTVNETAYTVPLANEILAQ